MPAAKYAPLHAITTKDMRPFGFDVIEFGQSAVKIYNSAIPHRHTYFELFLFTKGRGTHEIDFNRFPIEKDAVHFVSPGQIHKLKHTNLSGYVICFTEDFMTLSEGESLTDKFPFFDNPRQPFLKLNKENVVAINELVIAISNEFKGTAPEKTALLQSYLNIVLIKLKSLYQSAYAHASVHENQSIVVKFKKLISRSYLDHIGISEYAAALNISANYLNALCKEHEGKTASHLVQERLLLESKRLLYSSNMQIKEIAFFLNFENVSYFNRFFKKNVGKTPLEFKKILKGGA